MSKLYHCIKCDGDFPAEDFTKNKSFTWRDGVNQYCRECDNKRKRGIRAHDKATGNLLRDRAINFLGATCQECGIDDVRVLDVDHVHGGGNKDRKKRTSSKILQDVFANPSNYQLLCRNCNWVKWLEGDRVTRTAKQLGG